MAVSSTEGRNSEQRVGSLDALRFVAAMAVVLYHFSYRGPQVGTVPSLDGSLGSVFRYGYLGVDLFFVISGFVIFLAIDRCSSASQFLLSRGTRLYPAFIVCCAISFLAQLWVEQAGVGWAAFFLNMTLVGTVFDVPPVSGVYWSLVIELRFYALIALMLMLGGGKYSERILWGWFGACLFYALSKLGTFRELLLISFAPYFICGGCLHFIRARGLSLARAALFGASALWTLWIAHGQAIKLSTRFGDGIDPLVACSIELAILAAMALSASFSVGSWGRLSIGLGALTYPLYLIHEELGYMAIRFLSPQWKMPYAMLITTTLAVILAYGISRYLERPLTQHMKAWVSRFSRGQV